MTYRNPVSMSTVVASAAVMLAIGVGGYAHLANTIDTSSSRANTAAVTALRSQLQFWETAANQEAGELHDLQAKP